MTSYKFVNKMWKPAKCLVLICTMLFLISQVASYGHDVVPPDHNHTPYFVNEEGERIIATDVFVSENQSNYLIGSVKAVDEDEDDTLTYSLNYDVMYYGFPPGHEYHNQPYGHYYTINSETGEVHTDNNGLDFEELPYTYFAPYKYHTVVVEVEDGNGGSAIFIYQIFNEDENDNAPQFSEDSQTLSINENEPSGTTIGTVSATDADEVAGDHTYSIETENVPFTIESSKRSGTIKTTSVLDYEATKSYTLTVKVDDGFDTDTIEVTINITNDPSDDPPNNPPVFTEGDSTTRSIVENTPSGRNIGSAISATDSDSSDTLTYSLGGTDAGAFGIVRTTGQLQTSAALDYENKKSYEVTITVSDGKGGTDTITVTISVIYEVVSSTPTPTTLEKHSGDKQTEIAQVWLTTPFVVRVLDQNGDPLLGVKVFFAETSGKGYVSDTEDTTDEQGLASTHLKFRTALGEYTVTARVRGISDLVTYVVTFTATAIEAPPRQIVPVPETEPAPPEPAPIPEPVRLSRNLHDIIFSEIMFETKGDIKQYPQWIELYNTTDNAINLNGWNITAQSESITIGRDFVINAKQARLLVSNLSRHSHVNMNEGKVYDLSKKLIAESTQAFVLRLVDNDGTNIDAVQTNGWELPSGIVKLEDGARTSMIRRFKEGKPVPGDQRNAWIRAYGTKSADRSRFWYGHKTDIGSPGYRSSYKPLPVQLSLFTAKYDGDKVVIKWTTESELDNAGFNIYRSETRTGQFKQVNTELIQGAGTTGERNAYTWTDTTAKPNVEYYYQIEDVSFAGERQTLTTQRTKGIISAKDRFVTQWGALKR